VSPELRNTLEKAAEEAFAGMRAYHSSEIDHNRDAIGILTTVLAGNGGLIAAGFGALEKARTIGWAPVGLVAVIVMTATFLLVTRIAKATHEKIDADGRRYQEFKSQSIAAKRLLGLYDPITTEFGTYTILEQPKPSMGKVRTQRVLDAFVGLVIIFSLAGWFAVVGAWLAAVALK